MNPNNYPNNPADATTLWGGLLMLLIERGLPVAPRGKPTQELLNRVHLTLDMRYPVVCQRSRKLNYRFLAAEALWITGGDNLLAPLTNVNPGMARFSDDGLTLAGAYGPPFVAQVDYVIKTLVDDPETRQATLTLWRQNPAPSKDIPCTVAMVFSIRNKKLYSHVFMRSSDAWLGIPYDLFSFTMMAARVACEHNVRVPNEQRISLGSLTLTPVSSHLYEENLQAAKDCVTRQLGADPMDFGSQEPIPDDVILNGSWYRLQQSLEACRDAPTDATDVGCWRIRPVWPELDA